MKKTLGVALKFLLVLVVLLGIAYLAERLSPSEEIPEAAIETEAGEIVITNEMTPNKATAIEFRDDGVSMVGVGAEAKDGVVTIAYPGTYRVTGSRMGGQLVVDLGDFHGGVYIILDGVELGCMDGPVIWVKQSDLTVLYLNEETQNTLWDGDDYTVQEKSDVNSGACIYSADDLVIDGTGALAVNGSAADGIRSKDSLTVNGGDITVSAVDDGLQGSDAIELNGGSLSIAVNGDGVVCKKGSITLNGSSLTIYSGGDGIQAATALEITRGLINITTRGGAAYYETAALGDISAKGVKAENISISGGTLRLDTADDAIHAARALTITGGNFWLSAGDDAVTAASVLEVNGVSLNISQSYEALEADTVRLTDATVMAAAENNGIDGGDGGVELENAHLTLTAPRGVSSDGAFIMHGGSMTLYADGTDSLFSFPEADVDGSIVVFSETGRSETLLEKGSIDGALLYVFNTAVPAQTQFVLSDASGEPVVTAIRTDADTGALLVADDALTEGETYSLTTGDAEPIELTTGEGTAVYEEALPVRQSGRPGGPGR